MDRLAPTLRPARPTQGSQRWHRLLFSHWELPSAALRSHVPPRLELDSFEGKFFVGLVAFTMQRVQPYKWAPPFPTARTFHEINLRTYVQVEGEEPGVFFFSLDAGSSVAVAAARLLWHLPYHRSAFEHADDGEYVRWRSDRRWPAPPSERFEAAFQIGAPLAPSTPGSLEFFLAERYQFYAMNNRRLFRARVHHAPYVLHHANVEKVGVSLLQAASLPTLGARTPDYFSPGVDVDIYSFEDVA